MVSCGHFLSVRCYDDEYTAAASRSTERDRTFLTGQLSRELKEEELRRLLGPEFGWKVGRFGHSQVRKRRCRVSVTASARPGRVNSHLTFT